jgi:phage-related protein
MPVSKKMDGMGKGVFELRLKDSSGIYRVIYLVKKKDAIYLIHGFKKKTMRTPKKNIDLALKRIKELK